MTHTLVKIYTADDGTVYSDPEWHLLETDGGGPHALCSGEFVGAGESGCEIEIKDVSHGIPCPLCREIVKRHKAIRL